MPNYNQITLIGHLTRDPELRYTPNGAAVLQCGIAVNREYKKNDENHAEILFVDVEAWGKQAEVISKYCKKGDPVFITGRLKLEAWEDKTTHQKRSKHKVVVEGFQFLSRSEKQSMADTIDKADIPPSEPQKPTTEDDVPF